MTGLTKEEQDQLDQNVRMCIKFHNEMQDDGMNVQQRGFVGMYIGAINSLNGGLSVPACLTNYHALLRTVIKENEASQKASSQEIH